MYSPWAKEGGRGGSSRLFQSICLAIPLQWTVAMAAEDLWEMLTGGVVSISNSTVLFPLFQSFCNIESEAEVRLLSVHFLLLCVCVFALLPWWYVESPEREGQIRHISWSPPFWPFLF